MLSADGHELSDDLIDIDIPLSELSLAPILNVSGFFPIYSGANGVPLTREDVVPHFSKLCTPGWVTRWIRTMDHPPPIEPC